MGKSLTGIATHHSSALKCPVQTDAQACCYAQASPSRSDRDNLELGAFCRYRAGDRTIMRTREEIYARFPRLAERRGQLAGTLSGGERQMLALGRALMA